MQSAASTNALPRRTSANDCSPAQAAGAAKLQAANARTMNDALRMVDPSGLHQRAGIFQVLGLDRIGCPVRERADSTGRVVAGILRESGRAHYEQIVQIPALQIAVDGARPRIAAHD